MSRFTTTQDIRELLGEPDSSDNGQQSNVTTPQDIRKLLGDGQGAVSTGDRLLGLEEPELSQERERQAIEQARDDDLFQQARELEISTGETTQAPLRRLNQIRRDLNLPSAETIPPELIEGRGINATKRLLSDFAQNANRAVEGVPDMIDAITELVGIDFEPPSEFFEASRNVIRAFLPDDPRLRDEFFSSKLPGGLGGTLAFGATALVGGTAAVVTAGVSVGAQEQAERAREAGVEGRTKAIATLLGAGLGLTETALPLRAARALKPVDRALSGRFFDLILNRGGLKVDVAIEAVQELGQQLGSNIIAKTILKQDQKILEGVAEAGEVGGAVGLIIGGLARMAGVRIPKFKSPEAQDAAQEGADVAETAQARVESTEQVPRETTPETPPAASEEATGAFRTLRRRGLGIQAAARRVRQDFDIPAEVSDAQIAGRPAPGEPVAEVNEFRDPDEVRADARAEPGSAEQGQRTDFPIRDGPATGAVTRLFSTRAVPMPELVALARELLGPGKLRVKKLRKAAGVFISVRGQPNAVEIIIDPETASDPRKLAAVLAHEIGHLVDFKPQATLKRGNLLGRIASLREHIAQFMAGEPGGPPPLTDVDLKRLREIAAERGSAAFEVRVDEATGDLGITPKDVMDIWNSTAGTRVNKDLEDYVKRLTRAEKKSIVGEALKLIRAKGISLEELQRFSVRMSQRIGITARGGKPEKSEADFIEKEFNNLVQEEIRKRKLLDESIVREELVALSEWWTPYDKTRVPVSYIRYRESSVELYAQALSVFLNTPGELAERAPNFYRGFTAFLNAKPEAVKSYLELQELLSGTSEQLFKGRAKRVQDMFERGDQAILAMFENKRAGELSIFHRVQNFLSQVLLDRQAPAKEARRQAEKDGIQVADVENAAYIVDELGLIDNDNHLFVKFIQAEVIDPLAEIGVDRHHIAEFLLQRRIINERGEMANPLGFTPEEAAEQLEGIRNELGADRFVELERRMQRFHDEVFAAATRARDAGVYNDKAFEERIVPNKDNYAAFAVIHFLEQGDHIPAAILPQQGTFSDVADPFLTTILKVLTLNRLTRLNAAKTAVIDEQLRSFPSDIREVPLPRLASGGQAREPQRRPRAGRDYLQRLENGKRVAYEIPKNIADGFKQHAVGELAAFGKLLSNGMYRVFHPLFVTYNPMFAVGNVFRDMRRTWKGLGTIGSKLNKQLRAELERQGMTPAEAKREASAEKITVGHLAWAYWQSIGPSVRRARGINDETINNMMRERALGTPWVEVESELNEASQGYDKVLARLGMLKNPTKGRNLAYRFFGSFFNLIRQLNVAIETASKVAGYKALEVRRDGAVREQVGTRERAYLVRKHAGTPDIYQKGLATPLTNGVWAYSRVRWNGMQADWRLATSQNTAAGWWWRNFAWTATQKTLLAAAAAGLFGEYLKEILKRIPSYFLSNYDVIPLGLTPPDDNGERKAIFLSIPPSDFERLLGIIMWKGLERMERDQVDVQGTLRELYGELVPNLIPPLSIAGNWVKFAIGINPYDRFRAGGVVPRRDWEAGGWNATSRMVDWTLSQAGVLSVLLRPMRTAIQEGVDSKRAGESIEYAVTGLTGVRRIFRTSDRGIDEKISQELENEDREKRRFQLSLGRSVTRLTGERYRLNRRKKKLDKAERTRRSQLNRWYRRYLQITTRIRNLEDHGRNQEADRQRQKLTEISLPLTR